MLDNTQTSITYQGGENQCVFPIPFPFLASTHIRAHITDPDGNSRALSAGGDYALNMISDENGELILLDDPLATDWILTITRLVPITQDILFHNQGPNSPDAMEIAADKLTMIAQQLDERINGCLVAPEGVSAEDLSAELVNSAGRILELRRELEQTRAEVSTKAGKEHRHVLSDIETLQQGLSEKVDATTFHTALAEKADVSSLMGKADRVHTHMMKDVQDLAAALADKLDADDPRLDGLAQPASHADSHSLSGEDRIRPEDIGTLPTPPADGKTYLAVAGGWVEYIPSSGGSAEGVGTMDHSRLLNRSAADQHPQSAIQNLSTDLDAIRAGHNALSEANANLSSSLAKKADKSELPGPASPTQAGLLSAPDKVKIDGMTALPSGGAAGNFLLHTGSAPAWRTGAAAADSLPLMSGSQKGIARLDANAGLEISAGGALGIKAEHLLNKTTIESRLSGHDSRIATAETGLNSLSTLPSTVSSLQQTVESSSSQISSVQGTIATLGAMAFSGDAPSGGKNYVRKNGEWVEHAESSGGSGGGGGGGIIGEIRLLPFRKTDLPDGWYFCNGDRFSLASDQGEALYTLPVLMKSDWGITAKDGSINLPNLFSGNDGYFLRSANNSSRYPGNAQTDAMRNITGSFSFVDSAGIVMHSAAIGASTLSGAFFSYGGAKTFGPQLYSYGASTSGDLQFDASRCAPTAHEVRPMNIGMTPAIYLGV